MHHVDSPSRVITEMFRVARKAVLISDHNNFAFGGSLARRLRMALHLCGLLKPATYFKQGFNYQGFSEDDGWWYPYSLFNDYADIARRSEKLYLMHEASKQRQDGQPPLCPVPFGVLAIKRADIF